MECEPVSTVQAERTTPSVLVREAREADAASIREIFESSYGSDYPYPEFYDDESIRRMILREDELVLVAEEPGQAVVATGSVILEIGAFADLVGEFGRLAVRPEARGQGIGRLLVEERVRRVANRLHLGLMEGRVTHPFTQRLALGYGFAAVGFLPLKEPFGPRRESYTLLIRHFGDGLALRSNNPRIIPEAYALAGLAMENLGHPLDVVVSESGAPYPPGGGYEVTELKTDAYPALLRIARGRIRKREIFGPLRLHYGLFRLQATHATYLIARERGAVVGGIGFILHQGAGIVRVFELIAIRDDVVRVLLTELVHRAKHYWDADYVEIDVSANSVRMQRTLLELGFAPTAYIPAMVFHEVERLDVVRMSLLLVPPDLGELALIPPSRELADVVMRGFHRHEVLPGVSELLGSVGLFRGLSEEQACRIVDAWHRREIEPGETIFSVEDPAEDVYVILRGTVDVTRDDGHRIGSVGAGHCLGEVALLTDTAHSANAVAVDGVEVGAISRQSLESLLRSRPDIGVLVNRNLAQELGAKLRRADEVAGEA